MPDWITLLIEAVGVLVLCIWIVVPVQEFKSIFARLRQEGHPTLVDPAKGAFEPIDPHSGPHEDRHNSGEDA